MSEIIIRIFEILYFVTAGSVIILIISENRNPIKTISWILVLVFLPVAGLLMYLFFGQDYTRKRIISKKMHQKLKHRPLDEIIISKTLDFPSQHANLIHLIQNLDNSPLLGGNKINFLLSGKEKFDSLFSDIENAKKHIHIEYYVIDNDEIGNNLRELLIKKSYEGVKIRVIYDGVGSWKLGRQYIESLRKAGIETEPFLKVAFPYFTSRVNYRNHRKIVVIDGEIGYTGGMNVADRYIKGLEWGSWRDTHVRIEGKGVQALQSIFLIDWFFVSRTLITAREFFPALEAIGNSQLQVVNSGPTTPQKEIMQSIGQAIFEARESIFIQTPYFIPPESLYDALKIAAIRGVDVRLMLSNRSDARMVQIASRSYLKKLLVAGVKIYFYKKGFLHSKLMVIDNTLTIIGSSNFDIRSFEQNLETEAFIYDEKLALQAKNIFIDDQRNAQQVLLKEWLCRPISKRFLESFMRLFTPLL